LKCVVLYLSLSRGTGRRFLFARLPQAKRWVQGVDGSEERNGRLERTDKQVNKMDIHPPVHKRTTEQLLEIVETREQWRDEVVKLTQDELVKRGVPLTTQETRRKTQIKYKERTQSIKERATYTTVEKILIVLLGPVLFLIFQDLFMFQDGEGFKKKNRQGLFYLLFGIGLWGLTFYSIYS
jgi:hypothetical protein